MSQTPDSPTRRGIRWWPAVLVLLVGVGRLVFVLTADTTNHQQQAMNAMATVALTGLALVLWLLLASGLPWRRRLAFFAALVVAGGLFVALFEIEGVTGNVVPIITWRFGGEPVLGDPVGRADVAVSPWDSPQFLGPERNGVFADAGVSTDWQANPPRELWRRQVGDGWSSFAVVGDTAITMEQRQGGEWVVAYSLETGEPLWSHSVPEAFDSVIGGNGPRATPTVAGGRVFVYGSTGVLRALALEDGRLLWQRQVHDDHEGKVPEWGHASSPLVTPGGLVVVVAGGAGQMLVAYDAESGEPAWSGGDDSAAYSSPQLMTLGGVPQAVVLGGGHVTSVHSETGEVLWQAEFHAGQPNVAQPLALGKNRVLASAGYGIGSKLYEVTPPAVENGEDSVDRGDGGSWQVEKLWDSPRLKSKFANIVVHEGVLYGLDDGILTSVDPATGQRNWKKGRYGHGQILLVGDTLLVQTEDGELLLVEATPDEHRELTRITALSDKSWNQPVVAGRILLVRNHKEAVAYELPLESDEAS